MSLAGKTLKEFYPSLMDVNCVAHLLHNCAMHVCTHFKIIDKVIAAIKGATIKAKISRKIFMMLVCHLLLTRAVTTTGAGGAAHRGPGAKGPLTATKILR